MRSTREAGFSRVSRRRESVALDEDALAGALLGGFDDRVLEVPGNGRHTGGAAGLVLDVVAILDIGETVVEEGEHGGRDLLAQAVACAEVLVDPHLHVPLFSLVIAA